MEVKQIYEFVNGTTKEDLGLSTVLEEDLRNIVDVGTDVINNNAVDAYVKSLINRIGKVVFVNRAYAGSVPSVLMDAWQFGSVVEKIRGELPEATENESWELTDGTVYEENIFYQPKVSAKFFNKKTTFEIPMSFTEMQVKQSFASAGELNAFISMLYNEIDKSMTLKTDSLIMRTINNAIAETVYSEYQETSLSAKSGIRAINLLKLYNDAFNKTLTAEQAVKDRDFLRYAVYYMGIMKDRLNKMSTLFNVGGKARFTPDDMLHFVLLSEFARAADVYLQSDTYHNEFVKLPKAEIVTYWQGSGTDYGFANTSKIDVITAENHNITVTGVLGVMFDRDCLGVTNVNRRVTSKYNAKAEFYNNWYKADAGYFNDFDENCVVFFVA